MLRANRCAQAGKENIYPVVSQHYINRKPKKTNERTRLVNVADLLYSDPQCLAITTQDRLTITTEAAVVVFVIWSDFRCISTQGPSPKRHIVVLPGAISRLCSVSPRQIPVWDTDTPPYLWKTPVCSEHHHLPFPSQLWLGGGLPVFVVVNYWIFKTVNGKCMHFLLINIPNICFIITEKKHIHYNYKLNTYRY